MSNAEFFVALFGYFWWLAIFAMPGVYLMVRDWRRGHHFVYKAERKQYGQKRHRYTIIKSY